MYEPHIVISMWRALGVAGWLIVAPLQAQTPTHNVAWGRPVVAQIRFLYAHMRTEVSGCLYGQSHGDTTTVSFFIPGIVDPRVATDSSVLQGPCPNSMTTTGNHLIGIAHSHIRHGALCYPSHKDQIALEQWAAQTSAFFGAIMCAGGDSIVVYGHNASGILAVPTLDSLYQGYQ